MVERTYSLGVSSQEPECAVDEEMDPLLAMLIINEKRIGSKFKYLEEREIWNSKMRKNQYAELNYWYQ